MPHLFIVLITLGLLFSHQPLEATSTSHSVVDFLNDNRIHEHPKSTPYTFDEIEFPGESATLFNTFRTNLITLQRTKSDTFPYSEEDMQDRWHALYTHLKTSPAHTHQEMIERLSYFFLLHLPQLESAFPLDSGKLLRAENAVPCFHLFPTKQEVVWLFPESVIDGEPRLIFSDFLDHLFDGLLKAKTNLQIMSIADEAKIVKTQNDGTADQKQLTMLGWPAHTPKRVVVGWFCLYDRLKEAKTAEEKLEELSRTINLHPRVLKQMRLEHQKKLPKFACESCRSTALYMNGITRDQEQTDDDEVNNDTSH